MDPSILSYPRGDPSAPVGVSLAQALPASLSIRVISNGTNNNNNNDDDHDNNDNETSRENRKKKKKNGDVPYAACLPLQDYYPETAPTDNQTTQDHTAIIVRECSSERPPHRGEEEEEPVWSSAQIICPYLQGIGVIFIIGLAIAMFVVIANFIRKQSFV